MKDKWSWEKTPEYTGMVPPPNSVGIDLDFNFSVSQIFCPTAPLVQNQ